MTHVNTAIADLPTMCHNFTLCETFVKHGGGGRDTCSQINTSHIRIFIGATLRSQSARPHRAQSHPASVLELRRARRFVVGDVLRDFELAVVFQVGGDAGRAEGTFLRDAGSAIRNISGPLQQNYCATFLSDQ